jgi:hypothetical protein
MLVMTLVLPDARKMVLTPWSLVDLNSEMLSDPEDKKQFWSWLSGWQLPQSKDWVHRVSAWTCITLRGVVDAEARVRHAVQCPLVVFGLEAEVALDHDDDLAVDKLPHFPEPGNVSFDQSKLLFRLCPSSVHVSKKHTRQSKKNMALARDLCSPSVCRCREPAHTSHSQRRAEQRWSASRNSSKG